VLRLDTAEVSFRPCYDLSMNTPIRSQHHRCLALLPPPLVCQVTAEILQRYLEMEASLLLGWLMKFPGGHAAGKLDENNESSSRLGTLLNAMYGRACRVGCLHWLRLQLYKSSNNQRCTQQQDATHFCVNLCCFACRLP
jgi:hypothetical protein